MVAVAKSTAATSDRSPATEPQRDQHLTHADHGAAILQVAGALLWLPQAGLIAFVVGNISSGGGLRDALWPAFGVLILGFARSGLEALGARRAFLAACRVLSRSRAQAVAALAIRSPLDRDRPTSGLAASVLAEQAEMLVPYLARFRLARAKATIVPLLIVATVFYFSWTAATILLVAAPLIPIFMMLIGWRAKAASEAQLVETGNLNAFLLDRLRGLATIRSLNAVDITARRLRVNAHDLRRRTMAVLRIAFLSSAVLELFAALGVAMVAVYVGFHLLGELPFGAWGTKLTLGEGLFILLLAPAFFDPLRELSAVWHDRAAGEAAIEALDKLPADGVSIVGDLQSEHPTIIASQNTAAKTDTPFVRLNEVRFRHAGDDDPVIDGFELAVARGDHIAILGPSGSGKSTLLALIAGLAAIEAGSIEVDGVAMTAESSARHRQRMAWIGQRPHLFGGTIASNVALKRPGIDTAAIANALHVAAFDGLGDAALSRGVGEGGAGLSGGEGLRLTLARGAANPHVELILADEPTAHLDADTEQAITERLLAFAKGRTLIVATHDPVLAARMHQVVRLEASLLGKVA